jgi:hypothetical protein
MFYYHILFSLVTKQGVEPVLAEPTPNAATTTKSTTKGT